jgi:predicted  nucleic acid-binding Zn-ribbon protein
MTELEQAFHQELSRLQSAVSYVEEANQHTRNALQAAAEMRALNEQLRSELDTLRQQVAELKIAPITQLPAQQTLLVAGIGSLLLLGGCSWLLKSR